MPLMSAMHELPEPDAEGQEHSLRLQRLIRERIDQAGGLIPFSSFMQQALYTPGLGYYMAGAAKLGAGGDFITAPELSPLFGATLARSVQSVLDRQAASVLELGAGSGSLAAGLLNALPAGSVTTYAILEPSAELAVRQQRRLGEALDADRFSCLSWLTTLPSNFQGVVIANEVMDALPVERFDYADGVQQLYVDRTFSLQARPASKAVVTALAHITQTFCKDWPAGYRSELSLQLPAWINSIADCLKRGVILLIDYGYPRSEYYSRERTAGTFACYYQHLQHDDPFFWPGLQDMTSHVDFTRVAEAAIDSGLELLGYASQSSFLLDNDLLHLASECGDSLQSDRDRIVLSQAVKTLTLPGEMGERYQVMALGKAYHDPPQGFTTQDLSHRL